MRAGLVRLLEDAGFDVVGEAGEGDELLRKVRGHRPDVAIVDIRMPPNSSTKASAARAIRAEHPTSASCCSPTYVEARYATELLEHGAGGVGYLLKDAPHRRRPPRRRRPPGRRAAAPCSTPRSSTQMLGAGAAGDRSTR